MSSFVRALSSLARRLPAATIVVVLLLTAVLGYFAGQAEQDQGQESFSPDNPALEASQYASEAFASSTSTIVQVVVEGTDAVDVVSPEGLRTVQAIRDAVLAAVPPEQLSAAQGSPVVSWLGPVSQSIASGAVDAASLTDDAAVDTTYEQALASLPAEQVGITERLVATGDGSVAPVDARFGLALVFLDTEAVVGDAVDDAAALAATNEAIGMVQEAVASIDAPLEASAFAFELLLAPDDTFTDEIGRLFGTAALVIVLILLSVFAFPPRGTTRLVALRRAAADTGLTLFVIFASIGWMQGIGTLLGPDHLGLIGAFSPPTQIIPILLIGLGVDYGIHLTSRYREELAAGESVDRAVERASTTVGVALLLATMTTVIGFATNVTNPVPAIVDFGVLAAVGILVAFLLMLTFLPAARVLLDRRGARRGTLPIEALGGTASGRLSRATESTAVLAERFAIPVVGVTLVFGVLGAYGLSQLSTEFSFADFVPADNPVRATFVTIEDEFTGGFGEQTQVVVRGDVASVDVHNALVSSVASLGAVEGVLTVGENAAADSVVARIGQQLQLASTAAEGDGAETPPAPGPGQAPVDPAAIEAAGQFAQLATAAGLGPDLSVAADADVPAIYSALLEVDPTAGAVVARSDDGFEATQVVAQTQSGGVGATTLAREVTDAFAPVSAAGPTVVATSSAIITDGIISDLSSSQVTSLILTLLAALALLVTVFGIRNRRPALGAVTLFPVGLVVLWVFGMMAATGIPFGPVTSTMSGLAIGIGVPFTIHITNRFLEDLEEEADVDRALRSTLRHTGGALVGSAFTTMAGFAILVTSSLVPFRQLGLVVVYAIGFSLLASVLVLPSLLAIWARRSGTHTGPVVEG